MQVTQEAGVVPRCRRAAIGTPFQSSHTTRRETVYVFRETVCVFYPPPQGFVMFVNAPHEMNAHSRPVREKITSVVLEALASPHSGVPIEGSIP